MRHRGFGVWGQWRHICLLLQPGGNAQKAGTLCWSLFLSLLGLVLACGEMVSLGSRGSADFIWEVLALCAKNSLSPSCCSLNFKGGQAASTQLVLGLTELSWLICPAFNRTFPDRAECGVGGAHVRMLAPSPTSRSCSWEESMSCVPPKGLRAVRRKMQPPPGWGEGVTGGGGGKVEA